MDGPEYEEMDFSPPPKHVTRYTNHTPLSNESSQPLAPPRTTSRYVDRKKKVSGEDNAPPKTTKPKRPLPPPKPRAYEAFDEKSSTVSVLSQKAQSMDAPVLPPKPKTVEAPLKLSSFDAAHSPLLRRGNVYREIGQLPGDQMTLTQFVKDHSQELPLRVRVDEGFCGNNERFIISTGDVYNLHFLKKVKVASIKDVGGMHFSVPLNSSIKFGLLYNPENEFQKSLKGYHFRTVTDIVGAKLLPKLVLSTTESLCTDPRSSVEANELLLIKKSGKTALKRRPYIKVVNLNNKQEKTLYDECEGNFTTAPGALQLFLPELLENLGEALPLQTMLYITEEAQDDSEFPLNLTTQMVTLTHSSIETSIVATTYWGEDDSGLTDDDFVPIAIPIELEIEITVLKDESEAADLYNNTATLLHSFDPSKIKDMSEAMDDQKAPTRLYKNIRKGFERSGLHIEPTRIYDVVRYSDDLSGSSPTQMEPVLSPPAVPEPRATRPDVPPIHRRSRTSESSLEESQKSLSRLSDTVSPSGLGNGIAPKPTLGDDFLPAIPRPQRDVSPSLPRKPRAPTVSSIEEARKDMKQMLTESVSLTNGTRTTAQSPTRVDYQLSELQSNTKALKCLLDAMQDNSSRMTTEVKSELKRIGRIVENLSRNFDRLDKQVQELRRDQSVSPLQSNDAPSQQYGNISPSIEGTGSSNVGAGNTNYGFFSRARSLRKKTADPDQKAKNIEELASMDCEEVIVLLASLNMSEYEQTFLSEQVDGEILCECDDDVLRTELNVTGVIHRKKLMAIINGSQSPVSIIQNSSYSSGEVSS